MFEVVAALVSVLFVVVMLRRLRRAAHPVMPYRLEETAPFSWTDPDAAGAALRGLEAVGFELVGWYVLPMLRWRRLVAFCHPEAGAYAIVQETPRRDVEVQLYGYFADGTLLTAVDGRADESELLPGHRLLACPGMDVARLYVRFMLARPADPRPTPVSAAEFKRVYETFFAHRRAWLCIRGGGERAVRRAEQELSVQGLISGAALEDLRQRLAEQHRQALPGCLIDLCAAREQWPPKRWYAARRRAIVVHELLAPEEAAELAVGRRRAWWSRPIQAMLARPEPMQARAIFARLNQTLPPRRRWRKIADVSDPVPADVYERAGVENAPPASAR